MNENIFRAYSRYYDLLYQDKNYDSEVKYLQKLLARFGIPKGNLLEFGSGTGKHARLLVDQGYTVHGIELSAEMVSRAQSIPGFTCQQGDIAHINLGCKYDAVLSIFHVMSYQISNEKLQAAFANAAKHLKEHSLFIFDFWYSPAVHFQKPEVRVKRMADKHFEITRIAEPVIHTIQNRVDVNYTIFSHNLDTGYFHTFYETHPMRHISLPEIELLARINGFELILAEEFLTGSAPSELTWSVCVTLKKVSE
jgi:SAM-dependent methyltransferase